MLNTLNLYGPRNNKEGDVKLFLCPSEIIFIEIGTRGQNGEMGNIEIRLSNGIKDSRTWNMSNDESLLAYKKSIESINVFLLSNKIIDENSIT